MDLDEAQKLWNLSADLIGVNAFFVSQDELLLNSSQQLIILRLLNLILIPSEPSY